MEGIFGDMQKNMDKMFREVTEKAETLKDLNPKDELIHLEKDDVLFYKSHFSAFRGKLLYLVNGSSISIERTTIEEIKKKLLP